MSVIGWILVWVLFAVGLAGAIFPILPGVVAVYAAFFVYGIFISFKPFGFWFWFIQTSIVAAVFIADYAISALGVKKFGGSRASVIWSTVGLIAGPFLIPGIGIIAGPFLGAMLAELFIGSDPRHAVKVGVGSVVGFLTSTAAKLVLEIMMIVLFFIWIM